MHAVDGRSGETHRATTDAVQRLLARELADADRMYTASPRFNFDPGNWVSESC
jgi:hypothetical protein